MDWIKRNLVFVIGAVVALLLMVLAGWYSYSGYSNNSQERDKIAQAYEELNQLYAKKPAPGDGKKVDNIKLAKEQQKEAREFIHKLEEKLELIPAIPGGTNLTLYATCARAGVTIPNSMVNTNVSGRDYSAALQDSIASLQREATNSSVILPPRYKFSFEKQAGLVTFAPGTVEALAVQLGEVAVISEILNQAKVNSLDGIRRERVPGSPDDMAGAATDYINSSSITNELAIITPYEITFRSFTPELASVLAGFARSKYGLIVKAVNVEPSDATGVVADPTVAAPVYAQPLYPAAGARPILGEEGMMPSAAMRSRYGAPGANPYAARAIVPQPAPVATAPSRGGLQTFLKEKPLKITMLVHVVKLLPPQK